MRGSCNPVFFLTSALVALLSLFLVSCASERNYRPVAPAEGPAVPQFIELSDEPSISTVHFPRGLYTLEAEDNGGYYYRAPRPLTKHAFAGSLPYDGGIYVRKSDPSRVRGYIVWAGGRTKIGRLSSKSYSFR